MKVWGMLLCLLALPALAGGQSLAEVARKERERREKLRKAGASARKVTEEDLAAPKGELANDPEATPAGKSAARPTSRTRSRASAEAAAREKAETQWRGRAAKARARVEEAQRRYDRLNRWIRLGQPAKYTEDGQRVIYSARQLKKMADKAQADVEAAEQAFEDLREEARRAGVPPGWLR
jgi:hypothetical protein